MSRRLLSRLVLPGFLVTVSGCCIPWGSGPGPEFQASEGTYVGAVHLSFASFDGDAVCEREDPESGYWVEFARTRSAQLDDVGVGLPYDALTPGEVYTYRVRVDPHDGDPTKYTEGVEGWSYEILPVEQVESTLVSADDGRYTVSWVDPNDFDVRNLLRCDYQVVIVEGHEPGYPGVYMEEGRVGVCYAEHTAEVMMYDLPEPRFAVWAMYHYTVRGPDGATYERSTGWVSSDTEASPTR